MSIEHRDQGETQPIQPNDPPPGPGETRPIQAFSQTGSGETQPIEPPNPRGPGETQPAVRVYPHGSAARASAAQRAAKRITSSQATGAQKKLSQTTATQPIQPGPSLGSVQAPARGDISGLPHARLLLWALLVLAWLGVGGTTGALAGYRSSLAAQQSRQTEQVALALSEQYYLGLQDMQAGRFEHAQQRFEYILAVDPSFPGAAEGLGQAKAILYATSTPTATPTTTPTPTDTPTPTPSPTPDTRPLQELIAQARVSLAAGDWTAAIDGLSALRTNDPAYAVAEVDGMLFIALRQRGLDRVLNQRDLEGGVYDLTLAERFAPLDSEAAWARDMVRLYMYGSAFWQAYPEQAVYYFGQVAAAAPYLTDASGWTSTERYRASLVHYGDKLAAADDWCNAQAQYELALSYRVDPDLQVKAEDAAIHCAPPTATPTETPIPTETGTATLPPTNIPTETPGPPAPTDTPPVEPTTPVPSDPPPATETPTETPTPPEATPTNEPPKRSSPAPPPAPDPAMAPASIAEPWFTLGDFLLLLRVS